jgi:hypothetical protein
MIRQGQRIKTIHFNALTLHDSLPLSESAFSKKKSGRRNKGNQKKGLPPVFRTTLSTQMDTGENALFHHDNCRFLICPYDVYTCR